MTKRYFELVGAAFAQAGGDKLIAEMTKKRYEEV
jgi:hypothetical protein